MTAKARRHATVGELLKKPARTQEVTVSVEADSGRTEQAVMVLRAIGSKAYDDLLAAHPPTAEQKKQEATHNQDTFAPALLSACLTDPTMTVDEATELWQSDQWSRGELMALFLGCVEVNSAGLDVPFTGKG